MLVRDTSWQAREYSPENKEGYVFIIREKLEQEEDYLLPHSWVDIKAYIIISSFDPIRSNWDCHGAFKIICILAKGW